MNFLRKMSRVLVVCLVLAQVPMMHAMWSSLKSKAADFMTILRPSYRHIPAAKDIDKVDAEGHTPLMLSVYITDHEGLSTCIERGADLELLNSDNESALKCAAHNSFMARMLLLSGADRTQAEHYVQNKIATLPQEITALEQELPGAEGLAATEIRFALLDKQGLLQMLEKTQPLFSQIFSQTPAQLLAPLTSAQKAEYKKMFAGREKVKPSLHGSLMLYEHFDEATALKKYLKFNSQIHQGIANKRNGMQDFMPHIMSFLRKSLEKTQLRLDDALCKARLENNQELSALLQANGAALDENKFYDAHINKQFWQ